MEWIVEFMKFVIVENYFSWNNFCHRVQVFHSRFSSHTNMLSSLRTAATRQILRQSPLNVARLSSVPAAPKIAKSVLKAPLASSSRAISSSSVVEVDNPSNAAIDETYINEYPTPAEWDENDLGHSMDGAEVDVSLPWLFQPLAARIRSV